MLTDFEYTNTFPSAVSIYNNLIGLTYCILRGYYKGFSPFPFPLLALPIIALSVCIFLHTCPVFKVTFYTGLLNESSKKSLAIWTLYPVTLCELFSI